MADFNWCHGPNCHEKHTVDRVRGVKGSKVLRTRKVKLNNWLTWAESSISALPGFLDQTFPEWEYVAAEDALYESIERPLNYYTKKNEQNASAD